MTNVEFANHLRKVANVYEFLADDGDIPQFPATVHIYSKDELIKAIKSIGGKWEKIVKSPEAEYMEFHSKLCGLTITAPRHLICKRKVTWDCQPLLSSEEEAAIIEEVNA